MGTGRSELDIENSLTCKNSIFILIQGASNNLCFCNSHFKLPVYIDKCSINHKINMAIFSLTQFENVSWDLTMFQIEGQI